MKLVEILAEEMEEWPVGVTHLTQSNVDREIYNALDGKKESSVDSLNPRFDTRRSHSEGSYPIVTETQWQAERDRQKGGEWKRHRGGKQPVANDTQVECRMRNGDIEKFNASGFMWDHNGQDDDIMAYRVISQSQEEEVDSFSEAVHKPIIEALGNVAAEWHEDQIDGPIKWRDTVNELDAYIEKYTRERDALIERLASEGFALIPPVVSVVSGFSGVDMSDWRNWKVGDIVSVMGDAGVDDGEHIILELEDSGYGGCMPIKTGDGWPDMDYAKIAFIRRP